MPVSTSNQGMITDAKFRLNAPHHFLPERRGGIGEKFTGILVNATGSLSLTNAALFGCSGFGMQLSLSFDSGAGQNEENLPRNGFCLRVSFHPSDKKVVGRVSVAGNYKPMGLWDSYLFEIEIKHFVIEEKAKIEERAEQTRFLIVMQSES